MRANSVVGAYRGLLIGHPDVYVKSADRCPQDPPQRIGDQCVSRSLIDRRLAGRRVRMKAGADQARAPTRAVCPRRPRSWSTAAHWPRRRIWSSTIALNSSRSTAPPSASTARTACRPRSSSALSASTSKSSSSTPNANGGSTPKLAESGRMPSGRGSVAFTSRRVPAVRTGKARPQPRATAIAQRAAAAAASSRRSSPQKTSLADDHGGHAEHAEVAGAVGRLAESRLDAGGPDRRFERPRVKLRRRGGDEHVVGIAEVAARGELLAERRQRERDRAPELFREGRGSHRDQHVAGPRLGPADRRQPVGLGAALALAHPGVAVGTLPPRRAPEALEQAAEQDRLPIRRSAPAASKTDAIRSAPR